MFHVLGAIAQLEKDIISERTKAGLAAARARGREGGDLLRFQKVSGSVC